MPLRLGCCQNQRRQCAVVDFITARETTIWSG